MCVLLRRSGNQVSSSSGCHAFYKKDKTNNEFLISNKGKYLIVVSRRALTECIYIYHNNFRLSSCFQRLKDVLSALAFSPLK